MSALVTAARIESETGGPFDLINGIPVHPLVVHAAVVLVPLAAFGLIAMVVWPRFSRRYGWLVVGASVVAAGASFMAKESGEVLEGRVGEPGFDHAELGDVMPVFAGILMVVTIGLWLVDRAASQDGTQPRRGLRIATAILAVIVALGNLLWIYRVGDSGAKSVWSGEVAEASGPSGGDGAGGTDAGKGGAAAYSSTASPAGASSPAAAPDCPLVEGETHNISSDGWTAVGVPSTT